MTPSQGDVVGQARGWRVVADLNLKHATSLSGDLGCVSQGLAVSLQER